MSLNKATLEQLVELSNLIYDENDTVEVFLVMNDYDEQATRESLIEVIKEGIHYLKYDGNNDDFNAMYWFVKGIKTADDHWKSLMNIGEQPLIKQLPVPHAPKHPKQPQRYDQTDEFIKRKNKRLDDELFSDIKQKPKHKDVMAHRAADEILDEYHKHRAQTKFNYNLNKEAITIQASKANYQRMLNDLLNNKPLLRSLPPAIMKELKPYHQKIFEGENELFIDWISKFGHEFVSKADDQLLVNIPHDYDKALFLLNQHRQKYPNS